MDKVIHKLEIIPIQITTVINKIQVPNFFEKLMLLRETVGILLTIKKPINAKLTELIYAFCKIEKLNSKNKKRGNKLKPAAAGEGTPVK